MAKFTVTVLISGNGSNLQALINARDSGRIDIDIVRVISNKSDANGLRRATDAGIPCEVIDHREFIDRDAFDQALARAIAADNPDWVILAGFMRIIGRPMLTPFFGRLINLHPSLLPLYRGTDTYQRAIDAGDHEHGASIHFVTQDLDGGPVISQVRIPILGSDDKFTLAARLAPMEHRLMVATVEFLSRHKVEFEGAQVNIDGSPLKQPLTLQANDALI
jgi:phosphoribosylglycinamide formyltransferase-1